MRIGFVADVRRRGEWRKPLSGPPPLCACGCRQPVGHRGRQWLKFIKNHHRRRWLSAGLTPKEAKQFERLLRIYGLTKQQYDQAVEQQGGRCAICQTKDPGRGRGPTTVVTMWCVDHDHQTGAFRALLCRSCNAAIGLLKDSAKLCERAAKYLRSHSEEA